MNIIINVIVSIVRSRNAVIFIIVFLHYKQSSCGGKGHSAGGTEIRPEIKRLRKEPLFLSIVRPLYCSGISVVRKVQSQAYNMHISC